MYFSLFLVAVLQLVADPLATNAQIIRPLYTVYDDSGSGIIRVTASKVYNTWNKYGNTTKYEVELISPLINSYSQEIRVAIQWQWSDELGTSNERVAFYGEVSKLHFDRFRIDTNLQATGSYQFENWFMPVVPKDSLVLPSQDPEDEERYVLVKSNDPEIDPDLNSARFTFTVNRDEPHSNENKIWVNWGIFDSPSDTDLSKVQGSEDSQFYEMQVYYSDYFDRVFINWIYFTLTLVGSLTLWFALPLTIVPMIVTLGYVYFQPLAIFTVAPVSDNFTFDNFWNEIMLRWQIGTAASFSFMIFGDILTYIPIVYAVYIGATGGTFTNDSLAIFWVSTVVTWIIQLTLHLIPSVVIMVFLEE